MTRALTIVPAREPTIAERVRMRQEEAQAAVRDHILELRAAFEAAAIVAAEVANGGPLYPPGVTERAGREAANLNAALKHFEKVTQ